MTEYKVEFNTRDGPPSPATKCPSSSSVCGETSEQRTFISALLLDASWNEITALASNVSKASFIELAFCSEHDSDMW